MHSQLLAIKPAMWGGRNPTAAQIDKLAKTERICVIQVSPQALVAVYHV